MSCAIWLTRVDVGEKRLASEMVELTELNAALGRCRVLAKRWPGRLLQVWSHRSNEGTPMLSIIDRHVWGDLTVPRIPRELGPFAYLLDYVTRYPGCKLPSKHKIPGNANPAVMQRELIKLGVITKVRGRLFPGLPLVEEPSEQTAMFA